MAHYAFLDENNIVTEVIVGRNEDEVVDGISDWETYYGKYRNQVCKRTSYNSNIRGCFAYIGHTYNVEFDMFIAPQPHSSWTLDIGFKWQPPISKPQDHLHYKWDEESLNWIN